MDGGTKPCRRDFVKGVGIIMGLGVGAGMLPGGMKLYAVGGEMPAQGKDAAQPSKPNIILLFIDDLGYADTGPFGCTDIPTPNIDRLAEEGVTLTQTYVTNPPCCPSRASLLMGMYGQRFGKYGMARGKPLPDDKPTFAEVFVYVHPRGRGRGWGKSVVSACTANLLEERLRPLYLVEEGNQASVHSAEGLGYVDTAARVVANEGHLK